MEDTTSSNAALTWVAQGITRRDIAGYLLRVSVKVEIRFVPAPRQVQRAGDLVHVRSRADDRRGWFPSAHEPAINLPSGERRWFCVHEILDLLQGDITYVFR